MPAVPPALEGSWHMEIGVPQYKCLPDPEVLKKAKDESAAASAPENAVDRNAVERMSTSCAAELKQHPQVAKAVVDLKEGMELASLPGNTTMVCVIELYLCVFIALAQVACNLGVDSVAILCVLATDPTSNILDDGSTSGYNTPDAGKLDLKLFKLLSIVFSSVPQYASFIGDHFGRVGQSGRNAMMGFLMSLYRAQELHKRIDVVLHLCTNCATPFHGEPWGGGHIDTFMAKLKRRFSVNRQLVVLFPQAVAGMLVLTEEEACLNVLEQQRTPFDVPFLLSSLTSALTSAKTAGTLITFAQLTLMLQRCLASNFFPVSANNPSINVHSPDTVDEVDSVHEGSPGKGSPHKKQKKENCPVCTEQNCPGRWSKSACSKSKYAGHPHRNEDTSKYPPHVRDKIAALKKKPADTGLRQQHRGTCRLFNTDKGCHFGDRCKFLHEPRAPASAVNSFAEVPQSESFAQFQRFLVFERQQKQANAASAVSFEDETNGIDGEESHWCKFQLVVRALLVRTHVGSYRFVVRDVNVSVHRRSFCSVAREIRIRARLPCGRQGNPVLCFLLAHRFHAATKAKPPARLPTSRACDRGQGNRFPSIPHSVIRSAAPTHSVALAAFDSAMCALATLVDNPLVSNALRRCEHRIVPGRSARVINRKTTLNLTSNKTRNKTHARITKTLNLTGKKTRNKTHPIITKSKTRGLQSQTTNAKSKHNFPKQAVLPPEDSRCSGQSTHTAFPNANFNDNNQDKLYMVSDADIIRYTRTPVPSGSRVTHKVLEESAKEINSCTRKMHRLPFLTRAHFETVHTFLETEQDKCPAVGADNAPAVVLSATQEKSCTRNYISGTRDDTCVRYPDNWNGPIRDVPDGPTRDVVDVPGVSAKPNRTDQPGDSSIQEQILAGCYGLPAAPTQPSVNCVDETGLPTAPTQPSVNGVNEPAKKRARMSATPSAESRVTFVAQNDCGTNVHTSNSLDNFITYTSYPKPRAVSVANGQAVCALGEGRACISLQAEKLQKYNFQQRSSDDRTSTDQKMHVVLERCLHVPTFKQNFLDETQIRKLPGIHIVGDSLSKRIVDTRRGLQYSVVEARGQEYIHGHTLTKSQYESLKTAPQVNSFTAAEQDPSKREKKQIRRSMGKLTKTELKEIVNTPGLDSRYSPFTREAARIELCRSGIYTYDHGQNDLLLKWHHKLSHASMATTVRTMKSMGVIEKLDKGARLFCMHCLLARPRRIAARKAGESEHKNKIFSKFFVDCAGPFAPAAGTMNRYAMTVIDRCSGQNYTYYCKSQKEVPALFQKFLVDVKLDLAKAGVREIDLAIGKMIVQSDNASVFAGPNSGFTKLLESLNIKKVHGLAYTAQHQAKVERFFGTIKARARSLLKGAGLSEMYWEMAWRYCTSVYNYLDNSSTLHRYSPYQMVTGKSPKDFLHALKSFGARCVVTVPTNSKSTTYEAVYLGHSVATESPDRVSGHYVLDQKRQVIKRVHNLRVMDEVPRTMADNTIVNLRSKYEDDEDQLTELWGAIDLDQIMDEASNPHHDQENPAQTSEYVLAEQILHEVGNEQAEQSSDHENDTPDNTEEPELPSVDDADCLLEDSVQTPTKNFVHVDLFESEQHSELSTTPAVHALIEKEYPSMGAEVITAHVTDKIHYTRAEALADNPGYADSDRKELDAMEKHKVWETVPITSLTNDERQNLCRAHMLRYPKFSGEINGERQVDKLKSRLVFDGRSQSTAQSGNWTASNTPRQSSIMLHFGMAPLCENEVFMSTDISTAFLRAPQQTADGSRCVMRMPRDIATFTMINGRPVENVHILRKSLYGQRQSSLAYEKLFVSWACDDPKGPKLKRSTVDPCVFYSEPRLLRMIVYVDELQLVPKRIHRACKNVRVKVASRMQTFQVFPENATRV